MKLLLLLIALFVSSSILTETNNYAFKLIVFEGSDWCVNCKKLDNIVLKDSSFVSFLKNNNIIIERVDFTQKKIGKEKEIENNFIAEKYGFNGQFPTIIVARIDTFLFQKITYSKYNTAEIIQSIKQKMKIIE